MNHLTQETSVGHHRFRDCENMVTKDNCEETRTTVCRYPILVKNVGLSAAVAAVQTMTGIETELQ